MRQNLISFAVAAAIACIPACLFGAPKVSSLAGLLIEKGYTPVTLKRVENSFYVSCKHVSCKLNGRSARLIVDTGAGRTVIASGILRSLGMPLTKGGENVYGAMGWAGKNINAGEIKDFQIGPYQGGAHPVSAWDFSYRQSAAGGGTTLGSHLASGVNSNMDGLLGIDFLHRHQAVIDCFRMHLFSQAFLGTVCFGNVGRGIKGGWLYGNSHAGY
jgi:hypothetical protein